MRVALITTGSELTTGRIVDSNAAWLGRRVSEIGAEVIGAWSAPDDMGRILDALRSVSRRADVILFSGGLGPTRDDLTRLAFARLLRVPLRPDSAGVRLLRAFYRRRNRPMPVEAPRQAEIPAPGRALLNPLGTATGFRVRVGRAVCWAMPGVPSELRAMFDRYAAPELMRAVRKGGRFVELGAVGTIGLPESGVEARLSAPPRIDPAGVTIGTLLREGAVRVTLRAEGKTLVEARRRLRSAISLVRGRLGTAVYSTREESLEEALVRNLARRRETLAVAESCTGGLLSSRFVRVPGCSKVFVEGLVCYANDSKRRRFGMTSREMKRYGAVSAECVRRISGAVRRQAGTTWGIAISGIAGPGGGTREKPVGTVYIALAGPRGTQVSEERFAGDRRRIQDQAVSRALMLLWKERVG